MKKKLILFRVRASMWLFDAPFILFRKSEYQRVRREIKALYKIVKIAYK